MATQKNGLQCAFAWWLRLLLFVCAVGGMLLLLLAETRLSHLFVNSANVSQSEIGAMLPLSSYFDNASFSTSVAPNSVPTTMPASNGHTKAASTGIPVAEVCNALKNWLESDCANDSNTLTQRLTLDMAKGSFHSLTAFFRRLYPEVDTDSIDAAIAKHRQRRLSEGKIKGENEIDAINAIHELDSDGLLNSFGYFAHNFQAFDQCQASIPKVSRVANSFIWLPASCSVPFSARLKQVKWPLLPPKFRLIILGNSYNGQLWNSLWARSVLRNETQDSAKQHSDLDLCVSITSNLTVAVNKCKTVHKRVKYHVTKNGATALCFQNLASQCQSSDKLLHTLLQLLRVDDVNDIDMIVANGGNKITAQTNDRRAKALCGKRRNETGMYLKLNLTEMAAELHKLNFRGSFLSSQRMYKPNSEVVDFHYANALNETTLCKAERCIGSGIGGHQCVPGNPDWATEALSTNAYLHFCQSHLPDWRRVL